MTHLGEAEESRGHKWVIDEKSKAKEHPKDYFVPNFGVDHDIEHSQAHEKAVSTQLGHTWTPTKDKDDKWVVPTTTAEFKLNDNERLLWDFIKLDEEMN